MSEQPTPRPALVVEAYDRAFPDGATGPVLATAWRALLAHCLASSPSGLNVALLTDDPLLAERISAAGSLFPVCADPVTARRTAVDWLSDRVPYAWLRSGAAPHLLHSDLAETLAALEPGAWQVTHSYPPSALLMGTAGGLPPESWFSTGVLPQAATLTASAEARLNLASGASLLIVETEMLHRVAGYRLQAGRSAMESCRRLIEVLTDRDKELAVLGRVPLGIWEFLEIETACRVRMLSGPAGPEAGLIAEALETGGATPFITWLRQLGDAAAVETPALFRGSGAPSRDDVFWAGLRRPDRVGHTLLRELLDAASDEPYPMLLGSASLFETELPYLVRAAWRRCDVTRPVQCVTVASL